MKNRVLAWVAVGVISMGAATVAAESAREDIASEDPTTRESSILPIDIDSPDEGPIDEITVFGEKTAPQLRREIRAIEMEIIDLYNASNTDGDYDIVCRKEARIGSQIPRTNCKARIFWEALAEQAQDDERAVPTNRPLTNPPRHANVLRQKMLEQAEENPQLLQALVRRKLLQREMQEREDD